jgi:hypothetical protein
MMKIKFDNVLPRRLEEIHESLGQNTNERSSQRKGEGWEETDHSIDNDATLAHCVQTFPCTSLHIVPKMNDNLIERIFGRYFQTTNKFTNLLIPQIIPGRERERGRDRQRETETERETERDSERTVSAELIISEEAVEQR